MLWILTVHKKYEENSGFGCISINLEENTKMQKSHHRVTDLYPKCSRVLREFLLPFTKSWTQFVVFDWLQSCSSVGLHCASLLVHSLPQSEAPPSAFMSFLLCVTSSRTTSTTTGWYLPSVYNHKISITVKRRWTWSTYSRLRSSPKDVNSKNILPNPKFHFFLSGFLLFSFSLFPARTASEGTDVFAQLCVGEIVWDSCTKPQLIGWS